MQTSQADVDTEGDKGEGEGAAVGSSDLFPLRWSIGNSGWLPKSMAREKERRPHLPRLTYSLLEMQVVVIGRRQQRGRIREGCVRLLVEGGGEKAGSVSSSDRKGW